MKFSVTLDRDEDSLRVSECPAIPRCVSQGKTKPDALCLEVPVERGLPLTA